MCSSKRFSSKVSEKYAQFSGVPQGLCYFLIVFSFPYHITMEKSRFLTSLQTLFVAFLVGGVALAFAPTNVRAQQQSMSLPSAKNAAYVELAGNGLLYTVNYDRYFTPQINGRIGFMRAGVSDVSLTAIPLTANYLIGSGGSKLELGVGPQILIVSVDVAGSDFAGFDEDATAVAGTATIGYRYQPRDGGFVFRIGLTPVFSQFGFQPWAGLSLGYSF